MFLKKLRVCFNHLSQLPDRKAQNDDDKYEIRNHYPWILSGKSGENIIRFEGKFVGREQEKEIYEEYTEDFNQMLSTLRFLD